MTDILTGIHSDFRWFEDFRVGQVFEYGSWVMKKEDMLAYALMYDPVPFHTDEAEAIRLGWGGLIASGNQVSSICRRLQTDGFPNAEVVISPGWDEMIWLKPVFPGDVLSNQTEILAAKELSSRPAEGALKKLNKVFNQKGEEVARITSNWFVLKRPQDS